MMLTQGSHIENHRARSVDPYLLFLYNFSSTVIWYKTKTETTPHPPSPHRTAWNAAKKFKGQDINIPFFQKSVLKNLNLYLKEHEHGLSFSLTHCLTTGSSPKLSGLYLLICKVRRL